MKMLCSAPFTKFYMLILWAVLISIAGNTYAQSPSPTPTPKSEEVLRLEEEKTQAELRKAIAEANRAELEARFPKPSSSPLEGKTTISDGALIESQMVSYLSMAYAANKLITGIKTNKIKNLSIYNESDVKLLLSYKVALNQIKLMQNGYQDLLVKPAGGATALALPIGVATSFLGSFVDLTAFLRTNVEIKGQTFDIDEATLVSEVFRAALAKNGLEFETKKVNLYYPAAFPPNINVTQSSLILEELQRIYLTKSEVEDLLGQLDAKIKEVAKVKARIETLEATLEEIAAKKKAAAAELKRLRRIYGNRPPPEVRERMEKLKDELAGLDESEIKVTEAKAKAETVTLPKLEGERNQILAKLNINPANPGGPETAITKLKALNNQFDKFVEALVKADNGPVSNALTSFIRAERLLTVTSGDNDYWLQLKVVKAGGNNRIKTNLLLDIFRGGNRISHSGGAIVQYILFDKDGKSVASDTFTQYDGYIKASKIRVLPNPAEVDKTPK